MQTNLLNTKQEEIDTSDHNHQSVLKTVIIDDDYVARMVLREMLVNIPDKCCVLGEAGSVADGVKLIEDSNPELVLLDINLPDGTGFDLLDRLERRNFQVIFITGYSEFAIKAFKYPTLDYIVKPVSFEDLSLVINRLPQPLNGGNSHSIFPKKNHVSVPIERNLKTVALPELNGFAIIRVEDIIRCEGKRNYTRIIFSEGKEKVVSRTLMEFEHLLKPLGFIRVHRSHLVNILNVVRYIKSDGGMVELRSGELIKVSPKHKSELLDKILFNKL